MREEGGGREEDGRRTGGGPEKDGRRTGGGREEDGRRTRRRADTELKTKTPHVNVGNKSQVHLEFRLYIGPILLGSSYST